MILTDDDIRTACAGPKGEISISPFDPAAVEPASYDLRVGSQAATSSTRKVTDLAQEGFVEVKPGDFVIVTTLETIKLDNAHVGRFGLTSSHARRGLIATAGPQIDPGFYGRLTIGLTNLSTKSVALTHKDSFLTVEFHRLDKPVKKPYSGQYQDRVDLAHDDIQSVMEREYMSQTEMMRTLEALVSTVDGLKQSVNFRLPLILGVFLTLFSIIMAFIVAFL